MRMTAYCQSMSPEELLEQNFHLANFPTLRDLRIHIVMSGRALQAPLWIQQRVELAKPAKELRQNPALEDSLRRWWEWLPRPKSWMVEWNEFRWLNVKIYEDLAPQLARQYEGLADTAAALDWQSGCQGENAMNNTMFVQSMLELAENFCFATDPTLFAKCLDDLLESIQRQCSDEEKKGHQLQVHQHGMSNGGGFSPEMLLPNQCQFDWPPRPPNPQTLNENEKSATKGAILFGQNIIRTSKASGHKMKDNLKAWPGGSKKFHAWEERIGDMNVETFMSRILEPDPQICAPAAPIRPSSAASTISVGQAEAAMLLRYCSDNLENIAQDSDFNSSKIELVSSLVRPSSVQPRRIHEAPVQDKRRPASSHASYRMDDTHSSRVPPRQIGGGGFVGGDCIRGSRRIPMPTNNASSPAISLAVGGRPHSALQLHSLQKSEQLDQVAEAATRSRARPSSCSSHRPSSPFSIDTTGVPEDLRPSQAIAGAENSRHGMVRTNAEPLDSSGGLSGVSSGRRAASGDGRMSQALDSCRRGLAHTPIDSCGSLPHTPLPHTPLPHTPDSSGGVSSGDVASADVQPISVHIQLSPKAALSCSLVGTECRTTNGYAARNALSNSSASNPLSIPHPFAQNSVSLSEKSLSLMPVSPKSLCMDGKLLLDGDGGREKMQRMQQLQHSSHARDALSRISKYADQNVQEKFEEATGGETREARGVWSEGVQDSDDCALVSPDSALPQHPQHPQLERLRIMYAGGSETPQPQGPSTKDNVFRAEDGGWEAHRRLAHLLQTRKVLGKMTAGSASTESELPQTCRSAHSSSHHQSQPPSPYQPTYTPPVKAGMPRGSGLGLAINLKGLAQDRSTQTFAYSIVPPKYRWYKHASKHPQEWQVNNRLRGTMRATMREAQETGQEYLQKHALSQGVIQVRSDGLDPWDSR